MFFTDRNEMEGGDTMDLFEDATTTHVSTLTAPVQETATTGLREEPSISEDALQHHADEFARRVHQRQPEGTQDNLKRHLEKLRTWLKQSVPVWKEGTSTAVLTPKLELVESARMFESVIPRGESGQEMFADIPVANLPPAGTLPFVLHLTGSYLEAVDGVWSPRSLSIYVDQVQKHHPLTLREIQLLPDALKISQMELILNRADAVLASGEMPPIERSPFSDPIHSLRRMNQIEWREILEPLIAFDKVLRQDPEGVFALMEEESAERRYE